MTPDGGLVVFERDFGIWSMRLPDGRPGPVSITLRGAPQHTAREHLTLTNGFSNLALAPDGKKVAFTVRGDVFAASVADGGTATRVTSTVASESEVIWAPDSRRIAYVSRRDGRPKLFLYDFGTGAETRLTDGSGEDITPRFSPDGKHLAYARDGRDIRVIDLDSRNDRRLASSQLWRYPFAPSQPLVWSPDGEWLAFLASDERMFMNVWLVSAAGGDAQPVSGLANGFAGSIVWSADGETLYFDTQHRTQTGQIASIDLVPKTPIFREDRFSELFETPDETEGNADEDSADASADSTESSLTPVFDDIRRRLSLLPIGVDVGTIALSPDGKTLVFNASAEGRQNLYAFTVDREATGPRVTKQITSSAGFKSTPQFTPDGDEVFYLESGRIQIADVESGNTRTLSATAELDIDFDEQKVEAFAGSLSRPRA